MIEGWEVKVADGDRAHILEPLARMHNVAGLEGARTLTIPAGPEASSTLGGILAWLFVNRHHDTSVSVQASTSSVEELEPITFHRPDVPVTVANSGIDMCIAICTDMCIEVCIDMCTCICIAMCIDIRWECTTHHRKALIATIGPAPI